MSQINIDQVKGNEQVILNTLMYGSYKANRGYGVKHETLVSWGIGNEAMRIMYESEQQKKETK